MMNPNPFDLFGPQDHPQPAIVPEPLTPAQARMLVEMLDEAQLETLRLALHRVHPQVCLSSYVSDRVERWAEGVRASITAAELEGRATSAPVAPGLKEDTAELFKLDVDDGDEHLAVLTGEPVFDDVLRECIEVMRTKGADYAEGSTDRLSNFRRAGQDLGLSMREVLHVYLWKHLAAVRRYCATGELASETLRGRIVDVINYMLILALIDAVGEEP